MYKVVLRTPDHYILCTTVSEKERKNNYYKESEYYSVQSTCIKL